MQSPLFSPTCVAYCVVAEVDLLQQRPRPTYTNTHHPPQETIHINITKGFLGLPIFSSAYIIYTPIHHYTNAALCIREPYPIVRVLGRCIPRRLVH
jgi:hypothetical protein